MGGKRPSIVSSSVDRIATVHDAPNYAEREAGERQRLALGKQYCRNAEESERIISPWRSLPHELMDNPVTVPGETEVFFRLELER